MRAADVVAPLEAAAAPPLHEATAHAASDVKSAVVRAAVGVYATPVVMVLGGSNGAVLQKIAGYKKSPEFMHLLLGSK